MSMMLMVQAMKTKVGSPGRKLVLLKLADNANDSGECWPSYQHIADECEMGRSTVKAHIKALEEAGFITVLERNGGKSSNKFKLHFAKGAVTKKTPSTRSDSDPVKNRPGQDSAATRSDSDPQTRSDSDPRTSHSFEPVIEPKKHIQAPRACMDLQQRFDRFWNAYPKKVSKGQAETTFKKLNPDDLLLKRILNALSQQVEHRTQAEAAGQWMPQWKNPSTWLNGKCWDDQLAPVATGNPRRPVNRSFENVDYAAGAEGFECV